MSIGTIIFLVVIYFVFKAMGIDLLQVMGEGGGQVSMPLEKAFWGAYFGMLTDQFGIQWMVNYDYKQQQ